MNVYRLVADMSHLFAILFLLFKICKARSCAGISGKTQLLYLIVFVTRYLDLFFYFYSYYNTFLKLIFIGSTAATVLLIFVIFKSTYNSEHDTFQVAFLLLLAAGLAFYINLEFSFLEVFWAFSIYLEAVAILPQFYMIRKTGEMGMFTYHYLFALGVYRAFYIFNWIYRYSHEGYFDYIAFGAGIVQTAFYCYFLYTKEFLKRQARAYFQQYNSGKQETVKDTEELLIRTLYGEMEEKPCFLVSQLDSIVVLNQEDDSTNRTNEQLDPPGNDSAQPDVTGSPQTVDSNSGGSQATAVCEASVGELVSSSNELPQPQPQPQPQQVF